MEEAIQNLAMQKLRELLLLCGISNSSDELIRLLIIQISISVSIRAWVAYLCNADIYSCP